jgi:uncharacterized phage protein gp47/JayE
MPWTTPTLADVRGAVRDAIRGRLPGADANVPNSVLRVMSDAMGATCHLTLQYVDWLALQLMPDTAETEWLDRHADIWLVNADGSVGRKMATPAAGTAVFVSSVPNVIVPQATVLSYGTIASYETTQQIVTGPAGSPTNAPIVALIPGSIGNLDVGTTLGLAAPIAGISGVTVGYLDGGTDEETDDELRARVLERIRNPPMGGDEEDYVHWALSVPGVTRAWSYPNEMGIGTMTVRFMCDDLRADNGGIPLPSDIAHVAAYLDMVRPVTIKDFFVVAPIPFPVNVPIQNLVSDDSTTRANITVSLESVFYGKQQPGQTWFAAWTNEGIADAPGVVSYDLNVPNVVMPANGYMPVLGDITYS